MTRTERFLNVVSDRSRGPLAIAARACLAVASGGYAVATTVRNKAFDLGLKATIAADAPVVSIGNVTTGGTGKTPMVEYVARHYRDKGLMVAILSRGYGAGDSGGMNDEGLLLDQNLPDVPHLQGADRAELARIAVNELESQVLVLDDGLQHRRLKRELNIVLIDATCPFGYGWVLPRGLLREPLGQALRRADLIVLTRADMVGETEKAAIRQKVTRLAGSGKPWVESAHRPVDMLMADGSTKALEELRGKRAAIFSGLGNPAAFRRTVEGLGVEVVGEQVFPDHHRYTEAEIATLSRWTAGLDADLTLTSQKDLVKLPVEHLGGRPLGAVRIGLEILSGEAELARVLDQLLPEPGF